MEDTLLHCSAEEQEKHNNVEVVVPNQQPHIKDALRDSFLSDLVRVLVRPAGTADKSAVGIPVLVNGFEGLPTFSQLLFRLLAPDWHVPPDRFWRLVRTSQLEGIDFWRPRVNGIQCKILYCQRLPDTADAEAWQPVLKCLWRHPEKLATCHTPESAFEELQQYAKHVAAWWLQRNKPEPKPSANMKSNGLKRKHTPQEGAEHCDGASIINPGARSPSLPHSLTPPPSAFAGNLPFILGARSLDDAALHPKDGLPLTPPSFSFEAMPGSEGMLGPSTWSGLFLRAPADVLGKDGAVSSPFPSSSQADAFFHSDALLEGDTPPLGNTLSQVGALAGQTGNTHCSQSMAHGAPQQGLQGSLGLPPGPTTQWFIPDLKIDRAERSTHGLHGSASPIKFVRNSPTMQLPDQQGSTQQRASNMLVGMEDWRLPFDGKGRMLNGPASSTGTMGPQGTGVAEERRVLHDSDRHQSAPTALPSLLSPQSIKLGSSPQPAYRQVAGQGSGTAAQLPSQHGPASLLAFSSPVDLDQPPLGQKSFLELQPRPFVATSQTAATTQAAAVQGSAWDRPIQPSPTKVDRLCQEDLLPPRSCGVAAGVPCNSAPTSLQDVMLPLDEPHVLSNVARIAAELARHDLPPQLLQLPLQRANTYASGMADFVERGARTDFVKPTSSLADLNHKLAMPRPAVEVIHVDVGGRVFASSRRTLLVVPASRLARQIQWQLQQQSCSASQGVLRVFLDRCGEVFEWVLAYLRFVADPPALNTVRPAFWRCLPQDEAHLQQLLQEAVYYELPQLVEQVAMALSNTVSQVGRVYSSVMVETGYIPACSADALSQASTEAMSRLNAVLDEKQQQGLLVDQLLPSVMDKEVAGQLHRNVLFHAVLRQHAAR